MYPARRLYSITITDTTITTKIHHHRQLQRITTNITTTLPALPRTTTTTALALPRNMITTPLALPLLKNTIITQRKLVLLQTIHTPILLR